MEIVLIIIVTILILLVATFIKKMRKKPKQDKVVKKTFIKTKELQENKSENPFVSWWIAKITLITGTTYVLKKMGVDSEVKRRVLKRLHYNLPSEGIVNDKTIVYNKLVEILTDFSISIHTRYNVRQICEDVLKFIDMAETRLHEDGYPEDIFTYKSAMELLYDYDSTIKVGELLDILKEAGVIDNSKHKLQTSELGKQELHKVMVRYMNISHHWEYKQEVMELIAALEQLEVPLLDTLEDIQRDFKNINDRYKEKYRDTVRYTYKLKDYTPDATEE